MEFEKPRDYADVLRKLEGFPLTGVEARDGRLFFTSLSRHISLPLHTGKEWGCKVVRYSLNKLDVIVSYVRYDDRFRQVRLFDEKGDVIAHVTVRNVTRLEWLLGELCLHLDDDYDAVMNGALRVRIHPERVPFTVGDVFVNRGGAEPVLCVCAQASEEDENADKQVVAFKIDQDTLERKEIKFNVI